MSIVKIEHIPRYTYNEYEKWEGKWELIDGYPYSMSPSPIIKHHRISGNIHFQLLNLLKRCKKCLPLFGVDWILNDNTVICPDNIIICEKVLTDFISIPPTLIFEILSPSTAMKDRNIKSQVYASQGVKYYILIEPIKEIAEVFQLDGFEYIKIKDITNGSMNFDLEECKIIFDFRKIW
jgi:Uma2 family endonuclease